MPRTGRAVLPDHPHRIIQHGHHRQVVFAERSLLRHIGKRAQAARHGRNMNPSVFSERNYL